MPPKPLDGNWFFHVHGETFGPLSTDVVAILLRQNRLQFTDWAWCETLTRWTRVAEIEQFTAYLPQYPDAPLPTSGMMPQASVPPRMAMPHMQTPQMPQMPQTPQVSQPLPPMQPSPIARPLPFAPLAPLNRPAAMAPSFPLGNMATAAAPAPMAPAPVAPPAPHLEVVPPAPAMAPQYAPPPVAPMAPPQYAPPPQNFAPPQPPAPVAPPYAPPPAAPPSPVVELTAPPPPAPAPVAPPPAAPVAAAPAPAPAPVAAPAAPARAATPPPPPPAEESEADANQKAWIRRHTRVRLEGTVTVEDYGTFTSFDVSEGGLFIVANTPIPFGTDVKIRIESTAFPKVMDMTGIVIREGLSEAGEAGFAIQFTRVNPAHRRVVQDYVKQKSGQ